VTTSLVAHSRLSELEDALAASIRGKPEAIRLSLVCLLAKGHLLIEDVPGVGKTTLAQALARSVRCGFHRLQFTSDMLPSDVIGVTVYSAHSQSFEFKQGPVFTNFLLADEINRATPKTQSALLEAMNELQVSVDGRSYPLPEPFMVLATQNPIEQEGTYPLPEAQLDRFLFEVLVEYPTLEEENKVVAQHSFTPLERLQPVLTRDEVLSFRQAIAQVPAAPNVINYAVRLVRATRPVSNGEAPEYIKRWIRWGASPRASQYLILAGRARAACQGRFNVACEDVAALAPLVLRHRLIRTFQADAEGKTTDEIIAQLLQDVARE
jgi:MoxR-like ATPase